jgi:hypothetical protein
MEEKRETREEVLEQSRAFPNRIEQYKQAAKALCEIEKKLLLRKNPCDVFLNLDHEGTILFITPPLPGYTFEDTSGVTVYGFVDSKRHKKTREGTKEVLKSGEIISFETSSFVADGSLIIYTTYLSPVKNSNKLIRAAQLLTHITTCNMAKNKETKKVQHDF